MEGSNIQRELEKFYEVASQVRDKYGEDLKKYLDYYRIRWERNEISSTEMWQALLEARFLCSQVELERSYKNKGTLPQ